MRAESGICWPEASEEETAGAVPLGRATPGKRIVCSQWGQAWLVPASAAGALSLASQEGQA